jgi:hypothetical protein
MLLATTLTDLLSLSPGLCPCDKHLLLRYFSENIERMINSVLTAALEIDNTQRSGREDQYTAPIFVIVNEAGSILGNCSPQSPKEIGRLVLVCQQLQWVSWLSVATTHQLWLQMISCDLSAIDLEPLVQHLCQALERFTPLICLRDAQPQLIAEIKRCHQILLFFRQTLLPVASCDLTALQTFSCSLPTPGHLYFYSHMVSDLFLRLDQQSPSATAAVRFLLTHYR